MSCYWAHWGQAVPHFALRPELHIEYADLAGEEYELEQHISVHDQEQRRPSQKKPSIANQHSGTAA
jgi:hypothetical protein